MVPSSDVDADEYLDVMMITFYHDRNDERLHEPSSLWLLERELQEGV